MGVQQHTPAELLAAATKIHESASYAVALLYDGAHPVPSWLKIAPEGQGNLAAAVSIARRGNIYGARGFTAESFGPDFDTTTDQFRAYVRVFVAIAAAAEEDQATADGASDGPGLGAFTFNQVVSQANTAIAEVLQGTRAIGWARRFNRDEPEVESDLERTEPFRDDQPRPQFLRLKYLPDVGLYAAQVDVCTQWWASSPYEAALRALLNLVGAIGHGRWNNA